MSRRLTLVLALLALGLSAVTPLVTASVAQSTSACFGDPFDTVLAWKLLYPTIQGSVPDEDRTCRTICSQWYRTCNNMAGTSFRCLASLFNNLALVDLAECSTLDSSSRAQCQEDTRNNLADMNDSLQSDNLDALGLCKDCVSDCINNCLD